jgi:ABC-type amino acid transport substrate-binding protein
VQVLPGILDEYFVVIAIKNEYELRKKINKALLKIMKTENGMRF